MTGIDLHLHSNCSDGTLSPRQLMRLCADAEMDVVSLTDHDTIEGIEEALAASAEVGVRLIPGIEMSAGNSPEVHILGYYPDWEERKLCEWLEEIRNGRLLRAARVAARLRELGLKITLDDIQAEADERAGLGRMHIARALVKQGYVPDIPSAFDRLLKPGRPGYIARKNPPANEVIHKLRSFGMVPVLAHGALIDAPMTWLAGMIAKLKGYGLMGLECYHSGYDPLMERFMLGQAREKGLLVTGGSDYHGANRKGILPGDGLEDWGDREACLELLMEARESARDAALPSR